MITAYSYNGKSVVEIYNSDSYIPENEMTKIFDRLYRGELSRTTPGSGLGLTIAKTIITLHGGEIKVVSGEDKGTTFTILFQDDPV